VPGHFPSERAKNNASAERKGHVRGLSPDTSAADMSRGLSPREAVAGHGRHGHGQGLSPDMAARATS
jgi:hypothetical protein